MGKKAESLTGKIRAAAQEMGKDGSEFSAVELADRIGIQTFRDKQRMHWMVKDLKKRGIFVSIGVGVYRLAEQPKVKSDPEKRQVMWRFLRMRKTVSVGDLQEASGASRNYAMQWLRLLVRRGVVKVVGKGRWILIQDVVETPDDTEKAEKLRELRARQKEFALINLEAVGKYLDSMEVCLIEARLSLRTATLWLGELGICAEVSGGLENPATVVEGSNVS